MYFLEGEEDLLGDAGGIAFVYCLILLAASSISR